MEICDAGLGLRKSAVGVGCAVRIVLLRKRVFTPDNKALSRSAAFNSAGSINFETEDSFPVSILLLGEDKWWRW